MESYEDQLNEDISLAKKELENTTAELLPSYKHYSVLIKKLLNDSIQKVEKECRVHYEKIEKQKQESVLKAKEELKDKIVMYQQRADQIVEETKIENDKLFQGMSQRNQNEIERLKEKKVNLEQELLTLEAEQRALVDAINEDQYKYKSELNEIENQADERLEEIEKAYTDELKIVHQKLNERIEKIINEEEVEEDETYQEIDENTKQILRNENTRRIQILTEMQNEENNKIQELLSERQQKLSQFQSKMETAIAMAERKRIEEIENAERQYTIDREKLESDFEQEMKRLELLEEELIHNAKTIMNNEILSLEQSLEAKTKTSMTIDEDIEKYKCDCENVLANFIRNLSTETVEQFDQPKQIYCRIRQRIEIDFENNDEYLSIPSAKEVSIKVL